MLSYTNICTIALFVTITLSYSYSDIQNMEEICDNAIDDDMDGKIDLNDEDCACVVVEPESLIPNPSFEDMNCCPGNRSELNCADIWIQASEPTTDYIHTCGWLGWEDFPAPMPFPDGEAIMGFRDGRRIGTDEMSNPNTNLEANWKEYAGACLLSPLKANKDYRFEFWVGFVDNIKSPLINISFFGTMECKELPFGVGNQEFGCPTNGPNWIRLGSQRLSGRGSNSWVKGKIDVIPKNDITAIVIGPDCPPTSATVSSYYFFDNLVLADTRSFDFVISEVNHPCAEDFTLTVPDEVGREYQWYRDGIALVGEEKAQLSRIKGDGDYQVRVIDDGFCTLVKPFNHIKPVLENTISRDACRQDGYQFGSNKLTESGQYIDTFRTVFNCDSIVRLNLTVQDITYDTMDAKIFRGETFEVENQGFSEEGENLAILKTDIGCDSLLTVRLSYYKLYFPAAFSPNNDGQNDYFTVLGDDDFEELISLSIFDRWGTELYKQQNLKDEEGWDGHFNGVLVDPGVYAYMAKVLMDDGKERGFSGSVAVIQ